MNPHSLYGYWILSPARLPFRHSGLSAIALITLGKTSAIVKPRGLALLATAHCEAANGCLFTISPPFSPHRQAVAEAVVYRAAVDDFHRQTQRHFESVGAVVVVGDGEFLKLFD